LEIISKDWEFTMVNGVTWVINEYIENKRPRKLLEEVVSTRNANPRLSIGLVNAKPANASIRESKGA
jgi:hypothetical protein